MPETLLVAEKTEEQEEANRSRRTSHCNDESDQNANPGFWEQTRIPDSRDDKNPKSNNLHDDTKTATTTVSGVVVMSERRRTAFQPLMDSCDDDQRVTLPHGNTDRASPTSTIVSTGDPAWIVPLSNSSSTCVAQEDERKQHEDTRVLELERRLHDAQLELSRFQLVAETALSQRTKTLGNLKKKRTELAQVLDEKTQLEEQLEDFAQHKSQLVEENASLKLGLSKVAVTKDTIKMKLKTKDELLKECCKDKEMLKGQLHQMEHKHTLERELLEHYRKLARHTGYYRWGKPIRALEAQLSERGSPGSGAAGSPGESPHTSSSSF